jgi:5'-nucleotidase
VEGVRQRLARVDRRHLAPGVAAFVVALLVTLLGLPALAGPPGPNGPSAHIQLLGVNDFHGHLEPEGEVGGAAWLAAHLDRAAAARPSGTTIRVNAGDMVGASPLVSSHFHDEPTYEAMNLMDFDVGTVGNHEFDEGGEEMLRLIGKARFPYLAANTLTRDGRPVLPPYRIVDRGGVKVGFIGVTTTSTPHFLLDRFAKDFRFLDISDTVNRYVPELRAKGVRAIVVLAHSGAVQGGNSPERASGEIVDEAREMDDAVDVVVAGHTHSLLNVRVGHKLVVEALSYGVAYDRVQMTIDRPSGEVTASSAEIPRTLHGEVAPDPQVAELVASYARRVAPLADTVVGRASRPLEQSDLGPVSAAAQRAAAHADVALVNHGNLRDGVDAGPITYAELFQVHAYEHPVMAMKLKGSYLRSLLARSGSALYVNGRTQGLRDSTTYTVAANELMMKREPFGELHEHARQVHPVGTDLEALVNYLRRHRRPLG